jgi:adenylate kinase
MRADRPLNVILLGAPGSGKGTQAERLHKTLGLTHIASGDLFRENLGKKTPLGLSAQEYMNRGALVPDALTIDMLRERLLRPDIGGGVMFDGFPRTIPQAEALDVMMADLGRRIDGVIYIEIPDESLVARLSGRLICRECQVPFHAINNPFKKCPFDKCHGEHLYQRDDDKPETVRARLATFHERTAPLIAFYRGRRLLHAVHGDAALEDVTREVTSAIASMQAAS